MRKLLLCLTLTACGGEGVVVNSVSWDPKVCSTEFGDCMELLSPAMDTWTLHRELLVCEYAWRGCMSGGPGWEPSCEEIRYSCIGEAAFASFPLNFIKAGECFKYSEECEAAEAEVDE